MPLFRITLLAAAVTAGALGVAAPASGGVRVLVHLDRTAGQEPENIALEPDGSADLTFAYTGQVARVGRDGGVRILAQVPVPPDGDVPNNHSKIFLGGIVRAPDGALFFAVSTGTAGGTGVYRVRPGGAPVRVAALPAGSFLNGVAADWASGRLYVADSAAPTIWSVPVRGGTPAVWATGEALTPVGGFGPNGVKLHDGAVWVSNIGAGTLIRIPVAPGGASGTPRVAARGLGPIDDFAFAGRTVLAAINQENKVVRIDRQGRVTEFLTSADGLDNPTSVAIRGRTVYVTSGAYFAGDDPSLLITSLRR
jgi:sugar lactone lactonase YvrE